MEDSGAKASMRVCLFPLLLIALLAGCAAERGGYVLESSEAESLDRNSDRSLVEAHPTLMRRSGSTLIIGSRSFTDAGDCRQGDCTRYRVDRVWHGKYVGVIVSGYEDENYLLVGDRYDIPIGSRPIPSPSGRRFFVGHHDDRDWSPYQGASVWEWEPLPMRVRIVDTGLVMFDSFVAWRGDGCVEFTGARGFNVALQSIRPFWLVEQDGDWQVREVRPPACN